MGVKLNPPLLEVVNYHILLFTVFLLLRLPPPLKSKDIISIHLEICLVLPRLPELVSVEAPILIIECVRAVHAVVVHHEHPLTGGAVYSGAVT